MKLGAIDVGTNSCRMLVLEVEGEQYREVDRGLVITRLGEGVDKTGQLNDEAALRALKAIDGFLEKMRQLGVVDKVIIGTSALRDVSNANILLDRVKEKTGSVIHIIDGEEEARLNYLGVGRSDALIIDIGGGSTEFIWSEDQDVVFQSLDMGSVRMTERHISNPKLPVTSDIQTALEEDIEKILKQNLVSVIKGPVKHVVGVGGTITTLGAIKQRLETYNSKRIEGFQLDYFEIKEMLDFLSRKNLEERKRVKGLQPGRADVIVAGTKILQVVMKVLNLESLTISEHDLLYGVIKELYSGRKYF